MKKVSVIIPIYNVYDYLEECLQSIVKQTIGCENIEVILINDGSTDKSIEIIKKYQKKYPDWQVVDRKNKGLSISRNEGISLATSPYLMFLDSDDYLALNALEEMLDIAKKENSDIVIGRMQAFDAKQNYGYYTDKIISRYTVCSLVTNKKILKATSVCCKLYKTSLVKDIAFIPNVKHEDNYFSMMTYAKSQKVVLVPNYYYYRRYREGENTSIMQNLSIKTFNDLVENYHVFFQNNPENKAIIKFSIRNFSNYVISRLGSKERKEARILIKKYLNYLKENNVVNIINYIYYMCYYYFYYFGANIYYHLLKLIKGNK